MSMRLRVIALLCICTFAASTTSAHASHVACGDVITADTTLDEDLSCTGIGVRIGADGVTLDLGGHTLATDSIAVTAADRRNLQVSNGTLDVAGSGEGIDLLRVSGAAIRDLQVVGGSRGSILAAFYLDESGDVLVQRSTIHARSIYGLLAANSPRVRFLDNTIEDALRGVSLDETSESTVARNTLSALRGVELGPRSDLNTVRSNSIVATYGVSVSESAGNLIAGNSIDGIIGISVYDDAPANSIRANTMHGRPFPGSNGISMDSDGNRVERNRLSEYGGLGIRLFKASQNSIKRNRVTDGGGGIGLVTITIPPDGGGGSAGGSHNNVVVRNDALGNLEDGIVVGSLDDRNLLDRNVAERNGDDGIDIDAPGVEVAHNSANYNGDLGIEAVAGTIDGGGNRASGNANSAQCVIVHCR